MGAFESDARAIARAIRSISNSIDYHSIGATHDTATRAHPSIHPSVVAVVAVVSAAAHAMGKTARRQKRRQGGGGGDGGGGPRALAARGTMVMKKVRAGGDAVDDDEATMMRVDSTTTTTTTTTTTGVASESRVLKALLAGSCVDSCKALDACFAARADVKASTCERALGLCQKHDKAKPALRILARMDATGGAVKVTPVALRCVFFACAKRGMLAEALTLMARRDASTGARLLGMDVLVRACAMTPGGVDGDLGLALLESALRGMSGFGSWEPGTTAVIREQLPFTLPKLRDDDDDDDGYHVVKSAEARQIHYPEGSFKVVCWDDGRRRPADRLPLMLYAPAHPGVIPLEPSGLTEATRHDIPHVPGAFAVTNVLSRNECAAIVAAGQTIGLRTDPKDRDQGTDASRLQYCEFVVWPRTIEALWRRVADLMPQGACGINPRWRFFRYGPGTIYRRHVDGSWPAGGLNADGEYVTDASDGKVRSRLTFLIYLTEGFDGGSTTFYTATPGEPGVISARGVQPQLGAALCFPHGDAENSPIHEGSAVRVGAGGEQFKYIIRTDVLFDLASTPQ